MPNPEHVCPLACPNGQVNVVVGSNNRSQTSLTVGASQIKGRSNVVSDDAGNSDMMVRRKIRVSYKDIRANFRDVSDAQGAISSEDLFAILARYDIDMTEEQFGGRKSTFHLGTYFSW